MVPIIVSKQPKPQYDMQPQFVTDPRCQTWGVRVTNRGKKFDQLFCQLKFRVSYKVEEE